MEAPAETGDGGEEDPDGMSHNQEDDDDDGDAIGEGEGSDSGGGGGDAENAKVAGGREHGDGDVDDAALPAGPALFGERPVDR